MRGEVSAAECRDEESACRRSRAQSRLNDGNANESLRARNSQGKKRWIDGRPAAAVHSIEAESFSRGDTFRHVEISGVAVVPEICFARPEPHTEAEGKRGDENQQQPEMFHDTRDQYLRASRGKRNTG